MALSRLLSAACLLTWGAVLLAFSLGGRLNPYLIAAYRPLVLCAGVALVVLAVWLLRGRRQDAALLAADDDCREFSLGTARGNRLKPSQFLAALVLIGPLLAAVALTNDSYGSGAVRNRGVVTSAASLPGKAPAAALRTPAALPPAPAAAPAPAPEPDLPVADDGTAGAPAAAAPGTGNAGAQEATDYLKKDADGRLLVTVVDLLMAGSDDGFRKAVEGRSVELIGQVMPTRDGAPDKFTLVRMMMVCCAADARPVGLTVQAVPGQLAEMAWVKVVGHVRFTGQGNDRTPVVQAERVTPCEPPAEVMLF